MGVAAGDYDNDGDDDLFMTHLTRETNTLYRNDGSGNFVDASDRTGLGRASVPYTGFGTDWIDYDNDGNLDVFVANGAVVAQAHQPDSLFPFSQQNQLFRNDGSGRFTDVSDSAGSAIAAQAVSRGAAFGDIDNDGDTDIVVANSNGPAQLLLNAVGQSGNWLGLKLIGSQGNRDGYGARVTVLRDDQPALHRRAHADGSFASASDSRVLVGLGSSRSVKAIEVRWPSGLVEQWAAPGINRYHTLTEGTGKQSD